MSEQAAAKARLLRRREAADFLGVSLSTFRLLQRSLPVVRLPTGSPRYDVEDLERWIATSKENPCPATQHTTGSSREGRSSKSASRGTAKNTARQPEQETSAQRRKRRSGLFASTTPTPPAADSAEQPRKLQAVPFPPLPTNG